MQVHVYIAWAPRGEGLTAAVLYAVRDAGVLGWLAREHDKHCVAAFFALNGYFGSSCASFRRSATGAIDGRWIEPATPLSADIACPLAAADRQWLSRLQTAFARQWFFSAEDPSEVAEIAAYDSERLPIRAVSVRAAQFRRFDRHRTVWVHASPSIDFDLVLYLKRRLPQDRHEAQLLA